MKMPAFGPRALVLALLFFPCSASAQYIYIDSNGDGVHTAADVLHAVGPTVCDIWLDIGHNKDGSATFCKSTPPTPLDMFVYVADLTASEGTVSYSAFTNRMPQMSKISPYTLSDGIHFSTGAYDAPVGARFPAGKYLLGTLTVNVVSGTPSIQFAPYGDQAFVFYDPTVFGTYCDFGLVGPNSQVFGADWLDSDGIDYDSGGNVNQSPVLSPPADMTVLEGENSTQSVTATDPEGQSLAFTKVSGPRFMFVAPTTPGAGDGTGEIRLAPFASDVGTSTGIISVTDGAASTQASFAITVSPTANHSPVLFQTPRLSVLAGGTEKRLLAAGDPDGGTLHFAKAAGPNYVSVRDLTRKPGGASASLTASPSQCDVGTATASISVTDGVSQTQRDLELVVIAPTALPDSIPLRTSDPGIAASIGLGDLNGDGNLDLAVTHEDRATVSIFLGRGDGSLITPPLISASERFAVDPTFADFNHDGKLDLAVANSSTSTVTVLFGKGDGTFLPGTSYACGTNPSGLETADMNRDGILDLISSNQGAGTVSVLLGTGSGAFAAKRDAFAGAWPVSPVIADFDLDGRLDVAVANQVPGSVGSSVTFVPGLGDGTFGDALTTPIPGLSYPISLSGADWNGDGVVDLGLTDFYSANVRTFTGRGDGTFDAPVTLQGSGLTGLPYESATGDLNADGNMDLAVADAQEGLVLVYFGDGTGGFAPPRFLRALSSSTQRVSIGDLNSDARPDVVVAENDKVVVFLNRFTPGVPAAEARAFVQREQRAVRTGDGRELCVRLEPVNGSYVNDQVDMTSIALASEGTGSVSEVHAVVPKSVVVADTDRNGVVELGIYFPRSDLDAMFDQNEADNSALAHMTGSLTDGRRFCASVELNVEGGQNQHHVAFVPNPLNPQSKLAFSTAREGAARAQIFDIQGRLVRTLLEAPRLPAGKHEVLFDGRSARGAQLSSGVYFYRLTSVEGTYEGRVVILK